MSPSNEIARSAMKSSHGSDEIFGVLPQMKLNPPLLTPLKRDFIAKRFHPPQVDLFRRGRI
jgi:hypothetical protein